MIRPGTFRSFARRLRDDRSGLAMLEFAFSAPVVLGIGMYGIETANLAMTNMRVSQVALNTADSASRLGTNSSLNYQQLREFDILDVAAQIRLQTKSWGLTDRGRVTISSLEESGGKQMIHWQRCIGKKSGDKYDSSYGTASITDGSDATAANDGLETPGGMGPAGGKVVAPPNSGVMFVEVNYEYKPVVSNLWLPAGTTRLHYIASFIVRDRRDFAQIYNPSPAVATGNKLTCDRYTD